MKKPTFLCCALLLVPALAAHAIIAFEPGGYYCAYVDPCTAPCNPAHPMQFCVGIDMAEWPAGTVPHNGTLLIKALREGYAGGSGTEQYWVWSPSVQIAATEVLNGQHADTMTVPSADSAFAPMGYARGGLEEQGCAATGSPWYWSMDGYRWYTTACEGTAPNWTPRFHNGAYRLRVTTEGWFWQTQPACPPDPGTPQNPDKTLQNLFFEKTIVVENMLVDKTGLGVLAWSGNYPDPVPIDVSLTDGGMLPATTATLSIHHLSGGPPIRTIQTTTAEGSSPVTAHFEWDGKLADGVTLAPRGIYAYDVTAAHQENDWTCTGANQPPLSWQDCNCDEAERTAAPSDPYSTEEYFDRDTRTSSGLRVTRTAEVINSPLPPPASGKTAVLVTYQLSAAAAACGLRVYRPDLSEITSLAQNLPTAAGNHGVRVDMAVQQFEPYHFVVWATDADQNNKGHENKPALTAGALLDGIREVGVPDGAGWSKASNGQIQYAGGQPGTVGHVDAICPVNYDDPSNPSHEYEFSYTVRADCNRALNAEEWPSPWCQLIVNGEVRDSLRFFGDTPDETSRRRRRVRFYVNQGQTQATLRFISDATSTAPTTIADMRFKPVDYITERDNTLGLPYTGYNFRVPPGGGMVNGWTATDGSGYNDDHFEDWLEAAKDPNRKMVLRVFMELDQGMTNFVDDTWRIWPDTTGTPDPNLQYRDDWTYTNGSVPQGHEFPWVTQAGSGYVSANGFTSQYVDSVNQFLSTCDDPDGNPLTDDGLKVIAVLFSPQIRWEDSLYKYVGDPPQRKDMKCFRKTAFDAPGDDLTYHDTDHRPKYASGDPDPKDHSVMREHYLDAITDWLDACGNHPSLWGIDIVNEPSILGYTGALERKPFPGQVYYLWHGLGKDTCDDNATSANHRIREFLEGAYERVKAWRETEGNHYVSVVSDIEYHEYTHPRNYIDMAHPWDTTNPTTVHKVCDVFGLHWYPYYYEDSGGNLIQKNTALWCSDRLQPWRHPTCVEPWDCRDYECLSDIQYHFPDPKTDWMAEKPIMLAETARYVSYATMPVDPGLALDDDLECYLRGFARNDVWYQDYLDRGIGRHIESMVFWSGDGCSWTEHLLHGEPLSPSGLDDHTYGWQPPYALGTGGDAIHDYAE